MSTFQRPHFIGLAPTQEEGPRITTPVVITSTGNTVNLDLAFEDAQGSITNIQTMYIDASESVSPFILFFPETQQSFFIPAMTQGYYPIAVGWQVQLQATAQPISGTNDSSTIRIQFLNVPIAASNWATYPLNGIPSSIITSTSNAGDTAINLNVTGATINQTANRIGIYGFDIYGTGATAAGDVTAILSNIRNTSGELAWDIFVPVLGAGNVAFSQRFNPPLQFQSKTAECSLTVPAMGAGQTFAGVNVYLSTF
jgi:hypothetical protein